MNRLQCTTTETVLPKRPRRLVTRVVVISLLLVIIGAAVWRISISAMSALDGGAVSAQAVQLQDRTPAFDLRALVVDRREILSGGPPKDGIPALTNPRFIRAAEAKYIRPDDRVIGLVIDEEIRAYPLAILNYHEIVNDTVGKTPVAVTYCPLCDSAVAFDRRTPLGEREFGVSGLLYNSNLLMYDRGGKPESLWSQVKTEGVSGPAANKRLATLPLELTTWKDWVSRYPGTTVLSTETGHRRDNARNPYADYFKRNASMFPAKPSSDKLPVKSRVLGVWTDKSARAYPESAFSRDRTRITEELDGKKLTIEYNPDARSLWVAEADNGIHWMYSLWFAWYAFHPETSIYIPSKAAR
jgi:hypothetical protein